MKHKLFALDLDGTFLNRQGQVHPSDLDAVSALQRAGVIVTIVTGRAYAGSLHAARAAQMSTPIACLDGSHIVHVDGDQELFHRPLCGELAERVRDLIAHHDATCFVLSDDDIVHDERGEPYLPYVQIWSPKLVRHERAVEHPSWGRAKGISQVVCVGPRQVITSVQREAQKLGDALFAVAFPVSKPMNLPGADRELWGMVVRASGCTKGTAVRFLAEHHGISPSEVVAVGDWLNDVPMFEVAGRSFAMGQAPDEVKRCATDVLDATTVSGGGVAEAARRLGIL